MLAYHSSLILSRGTPATSNSSSPLASSSAAIAPTRWASASCHGVMYPALLSTT